MTNRTDLPVQSPWNGYSPDLRADFFNWKECPECGLEIPRHQEGCQISCAEQEEQENFAPAGKDLNDSTEIYR